MSGKISIRRSLQVFLLVSVAGTAVFAAQLAEFPMPVPYENSAQSRWLRKPVLETRLLDDMESLSRWSQRHTFGYSSPSESRGEMTLSSERTRDGAHSIRLSARTKGDRPGPQMGRPFGSTSAVREFPGEDWRNFNRLSFWVFPDLPGFHAVSLLVVLHNDGQLKSPGPARLGQNFLLLDNQKWNQVVWEIPDLPRDKVTGIEFQYRQQGNEPGASEVATFYLDRLELQRVETDYYEGWSVAPGRIAYSHTGYSSGGRKSAIAGDLTADRFEVISQSTGQSVLKKNIENRRTSLGQYQILDFTEIRTPGQYYLKAGERTTRPFEIGPDVWTGTVRKALNYFFSQRCGFAVPGIHGVCHSDWLGVHEDRRIVINGGWHDAGDVCQGLANTALAASAMLALADTLQERQEHPDLISALLEEARWGVDWIVKTRFDDGHRIVWATHDFWTNGIIGDVDDVTAEARNDPAHSFMAASVEALAHIAYRKADPDFAGLCLQSARQDWEQARLATTAPADREASGTGGRLLDTAAAGVLASIELLRATGERQYEQAAVQWSGIVMDFQQREYFKGLDLPLAGFFWESRKHENALHKDHLSQMHAPILGLARLCDLLPNHPDWMRWYSAVVLYSEYLKKTARFTEPYGMLPESLYRDNEYLRLPEKPQREALGYIQATREDFREQVLNGRKIGAHHYLRLFPVWFTRRGNNGIILPMTKALAAAAQLRRDPEGLHLAEEQLQWIVGRNPFSQSMMTGEGFDFVPHYSALSGDIVGSLPVGIETLRNSDVPYWSVQNHMNPKETWVQPVAHWISVQRELNGPGVVSGRVEPGSDGADLDLREGRFLDFGVSHSVTGRRVKIQVSVKGSGEHRFTIRAWNVGFSTPEQTVTLENGETRKLTWQGSIVSDNSPWVVVVIPDNDLGKRREVAGEWRK